MRKKLDRRGKPGLKERDEKKESGVRLQEPEERTFRTATGRERWFYRNGIENAGSARKWKETAIRRFKTNIRIYWSDCDPAGIAYYGNFFRWFEIAEEELFLTLGFSRTDVMHQYKIGFPRVEIWARFRKPLPEGSLIEITLWIAKRTQTALVFNMELRREGESEIAAEAHYRLVCVKRPEFKPVPIPEEILHLLRDYIPPLTKHSPEHKSEPRA